MTNPETAYRALIQHTLRCRQCRAAGGELADDNALWPTDRAFVRQWGNAEVGQATIERECDQAATMARPASSR
jgi:hypothetical protein